MLTRKPDFDKASAIAVDDSGRVFVVDSSAQGVLVYSTLADDQQQLEHRGFFGSHGVADGQFAFSAAYNGEVRVWDLGDATWSTISSCLGSGEYGHVGNVPHVFQQTQKILAADETRIKQNQANEIRATPTVTIPWSSGRYPTPKWCST